MEPIIQLIQQAATAVHGFIAPIFGFIGGFITQFLSLIHIYV